MEGILVGVHVGNGRDVTLVDVGLEEVAAVEYYVYE